MLRHVVCSSERRESICRTMGSTVRTNSTRNFHHYHHKRTDSPRNGPSIQIRSSLRLTLTFNAATATPPRAVDIEATGLQVLCSMSYRSTVSKHVESSRPPTAYSGPPRQPTAMPRLERSVSITYETGISFTARYSSVPRVPNGWFADRRLLHYSNAQCHHGRRWHRHGHSLHIHQHDVVESSSQRCRTIDRV